jgi:hypothetical protein
MPTAQARQLAGPTIDPARPPLFAANAIPPMKPMFGPAIGTDDPVFETNRQSIHTARETYQSPIGPPGDFSVLGVVTEWLVSGQGNG